jgi:IS4 transposase
MFPKALLQRLARETGAVRRLREVDPVDLFWVLVLSFGSGGERTIADLRRSYEKVTGENVSASSFYNRFTPTLTGFLRAVFAQGLEKLSRCTEGAAAVLGEIRDVLCVDSTVIRLHDALASCWPACRTNHTLAAMKLHMVLNVRGVGPQRVKITSERVADGPALRAGEWVKGRLLLFDLGYFRYALFAAIAAHGGFFLTRLKDNANPTLRRLHRQHRGRAMAVEGWGLREIRSRLRRTVLDAEAEICFQRR